MEKEEKEGRKGRQGREGLVRGQAASWCRGLQGAETRLLAEQQRKEKQRPSVIGICCTFYTPERAVSFPCWYLDSCFEGRHHPRLQEEEEEEKENEEEEKEEEHKHYKKKHEYSVSKAFLATFCHI